MLTSISLSQKWKRVSISALESKIFSMLPINLGGKVHNRLILILLFKKRQLHSAGHCNVISLWHHVKDVYRYQENYSWLLTWKQDC